MSLARAQAAVTASKELPDGLQFSVEGGTLRIQFWSEGIVRVTYAAAAELPPLKSLAVVATQATVRWKRQEDGQAFTLATPRVKLRVDKQTGAVALLDLADRPLLREAAQSRKIEPATQAGVTGTSCTLSFELPPDEGDSYRYEKGAFATIPIAWDDAAKILTLGPTKATSPAC
jgi:hypothetical protein